MKTCLYLYQTAKGNWSAKTGDGQVLVGHDPSHRFKIWNKSFYSLQFGTFLQMQRRYYNISFHIAPAGLPLNVKRLEKEFGFLWVERACILPE